jgi:HEXXH motif-containing protein
MVMSGTPEMDGPAETLFAPSVDRAAALDAWVRARLADSVEIIANALRDSGCETGLDSVGAALAETRRGPVSPGLFAIYHDLAVAAGEDDAARAASLLDEFTTLALKGGELSGIVTMRDEDLEGQASRYRRMVDDDQSYGVSLEPVDAATKESMRALIAESMALIREADPELASQIDVLGRQLVLAEGDAGSLKFSGASTFFLWGALVLNPKMNEDALTLAETLAHESGHALLFGLCDAEPLTLNAADERYRSPLRLDPRPIEGVVHATYVLARMERAMRAIAARCPLPPEERERAGRMADVSRDYFLDGLKIVREHARFTERGRTVFEACLKNPSTRSEEGEPSHVGCVGAEAADQPKDQQDHNDNPQHAAEPGAAITAIAVIPAPAADNQDKDDNQK